MSNHDKPKRKRPPRSDYVNEFIRQRYVRKQVNIPNDLWDQLADKIPDGMFTHKVIELLKKEYNV